MFYDDVATAYGDELRSLYDAGCRYVQMDDTNMAYLCDEKMREAARQRGDDPNELPHRYASFINKVVAHKPAGMTLAMHLCRGNFKSTHAAAGNYEPVAEALLSEMNLDAYFMEYDDERSGDFRPLRFLPKGKIVVLGLVTTKFGEMESKDALKRRIDEAAKYAPLDQLCLSARSAASPAPCTATTSRSRRSAPSCGWWSRRPPKSGARQSSRSTCAGSFVVRTASNAACASGKRRRSRFSHCLSRPQRWRGATWPAMRRQ